MTTISQNHKSAASKILTVFLNWNWIFSSWVINASMEMWNSSDKHPIHYVAQIYSYLCMEHLKNPKA